jgi:hypothetical protein
MQNTTPASDTTVSPAHRKQIVADAASYALSATLAVHAPDMTLPGPVAEALARWETANAAFHAAVATETAVA